MTLGAAFGSDLFESSTGSKRPPGPGYGPRRRPDENGTRLPDGFRSHVIATGHEEVAGTGYTWHEASDGMARFPVAGGGWILVSNSETPKGGASAIRFSAAGAARHLERRLARYAR